jgi:excisionase family DNA binding protein
MNSVTHDNSVTKNDLPVERSIPDPATEPMITVERAAAVVGVSKRHGYAAAKSGEWPSIRIGTSVRINTARWLRAVGLDEELAA